MQTIILTTIVILKFHKDFWGKAECFFNLDMNDTNDIEIIKHNTTMSIGFQVLLKISLIFGQQSAAGRCVHWMAFFWQFRHALAVSLYRFSSLNSDSTSAGETQPRSHWRAPAASSSRFFKSNHSGVSGSFK